MKTISVAIAFSVAAAVSGSALALHEDAADPGVKFRHQVMETMKGSVGATLSILKGEGAAEDLSAHANLIAAGSHAAKATFEHKVAGGYTLPDAWDNWDDFSARLETFTQDADAYAAAAANGDMATAAPAFKSFGNCKACHDKYRKEHKIGRF